METKYTSDGKKVIVVGKLNAQETIVQEIFVQNDAEIPSGENFVVKSLHDAPSESWRQKNLRELEERYDRDRKSWDSKIETLNKSFSNNAKLLELKIRSNETLSNNLDSDELETFSLFMSGQITHVVIENYGRFVISDFNNEIEYKDSWDYGLKLVTLFGKHSESDPRKRKIGFMLNQYYDGSGHNKSITPFTSYESAFEFCKTELQKNISKKEVYSQYDLEEAEKFGVELDKLKLRAYCQKSLDSQKDALERETKVVEKYDLQVKTLETKIASLK